MVLSSVLGVHGPCSRSPSMDYHKIANKPKRKGQHYRRYSYGSVVSSHLKSKYLIM